jgi:hypothetical protein
MARKSKEIVWSHLNDCNGDVAKKWYVEFSVKKSSDRRKSCSKSFSDALLENKLGGAFELQRAFRTVI